MAHTFAAVPDDIYTAVTITINRFNPMMNWPLDGFVLEQGQLLA